MSKKQGEDWDGGPEFTSAGVPWHDVPEFTRSLDGWPQRACANQFVVDRRCAGARRFYTLTEPARGSAARLESDD